MRVVWANSALLGTLLGALVATRCALDENGSGDGAAPIPDATGELTILPEASVDSGTDDATDAPAACPTTLAGPSMVAVDEYCIDSTEVTVAQYSSFIVAQDGGIPEAGTYCSWMNNLQPNSTQNTPTEAQVRVNWCQAQAYCVWAGKRLCNARDGGVMPWNVVDTQSRWFNACSAGGTKTYCYGSAWDAGTCNDNGNVGQVEPVKSFPDCTGGSGLFDMTGNASEWVDSCSKYVDDNDMCLVIGGDWGSNDNSSHCNSVHTDQHRHDNTDWIGFRCCYP